MPVAVGPASAVTLGPVTTVRTRLPTGVAEKARRFRLLLDAYGFEPDISIVRAGIARTREFLGHMQKLAADDSEHEVELARRGLLEEVALEIA
jgi:hypothetical protein